MCEECELDLQKEIWRLEERVAELEEQLRLLDDRDSVRWVDRRVE